MSLAKEKLKELKQEFVGLKSENFYDPYPYCLKLAKCITLITEILEDISEKSSCNTKKKGSSK